MIADLNPHAEPGHNVREILREAADANLEQLLVIGRSPDGHMFAQSSTGNYGDILVLLETFRHALNKDMLA